MMYGENEKASVEEKKEHYIFYCSYYTTYFSVERIQKSLIQLQKTSSTTFNLKDPIMFQTSQKDQVQ
jgi:uncharacterized protein YutD